MVVIEASCHPVYYFFKYDEILFFLKQERAYMMLRMGGDGGSDYGSWEAESYEHDGDFDEDDYDDDDDASEEDNDASDVGVDNGEGDASNEHAHSEGEEDDDENVELDPSAFPDDEAYARALQDSEEQDMAARLLALAGINESESPSWLLLSSLILPSNMY